MKIRILLLFFALFFGNAVLWGQGPGEEDFPPHLSEEKREKIKTYKIGYLTDKLNLTSEEAAKFWPLYNSHHDKMHALRKRDPLMKKVRRGGDLTEAEMEQVINREIEIREQSVILLKEFHAELKTILPTKKIFNLYKAERSFKKELMKKMRNRERRGGGRRR